MVSWLIAVPLFWIIAALYLGGAEINIEGGGAVRQLSGLLLHFVAYLVLFGVVRSLSSGIVGAEFSIVVAVILSTMLLPLVGRLSFRVVGVRITSADAS